jgi:hypothetical protein
MEAFDAERSKLEVNNVRLKLHEYCIQISVSGAAENPLTAG